MKNFHIIIDTNAQDHTLQLDKMIPTDFKRIGLKSIVITLESTKIYKNIFIHCDILNKDDNIYNGEQSDILAIVPNNRHSSRKYVACMFENCLYKNIKSSQFTSIR